MRITQFIDTLASGGCQRQLIELVKRLATEPKVECQLITMSEDIHFQDLEKIDIKIHFLIRKSRRDPLIFLKLFKLLQQTKPDILHTWSSMCSIYAIPAVKILNIKLINGFIRNAPPKLKITSKEWIRSKLTFPFSHAVVANSMAGLAAYRPPNYKSICIPNGFDFNRINNLADAQKIRKYYNINTNYIVGMVASFTDKKDYKAFFSSAEMILTQRTDVTFITIGDGNMFTALKDKTPKAIQSNIRFLGKLKNVEEVINIFTVGVLVSTQGEGISNTIMEYMALAKPVVGTDCQGNRELVVDGKTGFLVQRGDADDLARKILVLLDSKALARDFGQAGKRHLLDNFNIENFTRKNIELYTKLTSLQY